MKVLVLLKEYVTAGRTWTPGTLIRLPDDEADVLIADGIAEERRIAGPTETKS